VATAAVLRRAATLSTTATVGSARMLSAGVTISRPPFAPRGSRTASSASFSHAMSTSPMPRSTKVIVAARAPVSSTGTFWKIPWTTARALSSLLVAR